jgi:hypothetical protein
MAESLLPGATTVLYETLGVLLQSCWVPAAWALARALGLTRGRATWLVVALIPSHFFVLNTAYPWPKLLAARFVVGSVCLLLLRPPERGPLGWTEAVVAATLACLGLLAHPAVATTLIGVGLLLLLPRSFPGWRSVPVALLVAAALGGPWVAYQRVQPLTYSLSKRFLGGASADDPRSVGALVLRAWTTQPAAALAREKGRLLRRAMGFDPPREQSLGRRVRRATRDRLGPALGVLNVGWLLAFAGLPRRTTATSRRLVRRTLVASLVCLGVSIVLLFESDYLHHTSYATVMLMFVGLTAAVLALPPWLAGVVLGAHVVVSLVVFSAQLEPWPMVIALPTLLWALAAYAGLVAGAATISRGSARPAPGPPVGARR